MPHKRPPMCQGSPVSEERVSIVVPTFNGLAHIADAVASVRSQSYRNIELIAVDGGSSDGTVDWLRSQSLDPQVLPAGTPPETTWTEATRAARGEFVVLLCQDDVLYSDAIASQVAQFERFPGISAAIAQRDIIDARGNVVKRNRGLMGLSSGVVTGPEVMRQCYLRGTNVVGEPHVIMFRRGALLEAMPWDGALPYFLDMATYAKVLDHAGVEVATRRESIGAFRVSSSSWSTRLVAEQLSQTRQWQRKYEQSHPVPAVDRRRAAINAWIQAQGRRAFYLMLRSRGRWSSA